LIELDRVIHLALAEVAVIEHRGVVDVRLDAIDLGALAVGAEELLDGELQGTAIRPAAAAGTAEPTARVVLDRDDALDRPLAEGAGVADDQAPAVILDHPREDLAGAGAEVVDQDDERAVPGRS